MARGRASVSAAGAAGAGGAPNKGSGTVTVHVPLAFRRGGSRKAVLSPHGSAAVRPQPIQAPLMKALARAFHWRRLIETGLYATVAELATAEKVNASYASRLLRLTLLAPEIVEAAFSGDAAAPALKDVLRPFPVEWVAQRLALKLVLLECP